MNCGEPWKPWRNIITLIKVLCLNLFLNIHVQYTRICVHALMIAMSGNIILKARPIILQVSATIRHLPPPGSGFLLHDRCRITLLSPAKLTSGTPAPFECSICARCSPCAANGYYLCSLLQGTGNFLDTSVRRYHRHPRRRKINLIVDP